MRVLHLVSCRGWSSDAYWAAEVCRELERAGHEATLVCRRGSEERVIARARAAGVARTETLALASGIEPVSDAGDLRWLRARLSQVDVVHVHRAKEHWLAALANRLCARPRPLVRTRHIVQVVRPHALNRWLYRRATDLVVAVTEAIRRQYVAGGLVPADRVVTLHGGADGARFHEEVSGRDFRRSLGVPDDLPMVGLVSGLRAMKGHGTLIEAARRLAGAGWRFQLLLVGRGPLEREISAAVDRAGIRSRVTIAGFVPELPPAMAACDVAVYCPVESEGMSRVVFEYLAMGKALVASRVGAVPEVLVDGETALLVPAEEPALLAVAIGRLLGDRELGARLGGAAARLAHERFVAARLAERLVPLYARAATRAGQAR